MAANFFIEAEQEFMSAMYQRHLIAKTMQEAS
jgi:hypothetical protein